MFKACLLTPQSGTSVTTTFFTATLLFMTSPVPAAVEPVTIDSLLAVVADTALSFQTRSDASKAAARKDASGHSDAARARLLMSAPSPGNLVAAQSSAKRALKWDRHNAEYIGLMSRLLWRIGRRTSSLGYAERAIKANPNHPVGYYWSGRFHFWETMKYLWMSRVETNTDSRGVTRSHRIEMRRWGEEARERAESAFTHVLRLDPGHTAARRYLGLIYYQTRRPEELRELFRSVVLEAPDDPLGHFTIGMSYHLDRDYERAYRAYNKGLHRMPAEQQRFMLAVFTDNSTDTLESLPDMKTLQRFWTGKNPLYMSPVNERMLEQCRRVTYVNLRYGDPEKGIAGWTTDRGQAFIRFGDPIALQARPPEMNTGIDDPIVLQRNQFYEKWWFGKTSDQYQFGKELWEYEDFILIFDNTDTRDSWKFRIASLDGAIIGLDDLVERVPERFVDPFKDRRFPVPYQVGQFRGKSGQSRIEIYYAIPSTKVETEKSKGTAVVDLTKGLFLFTTDWDTLDIQKTAVDRLAWIKDRGVGDGYLLSGEVLNLAPGEYHIAGEVMGRKSEGVGGFKTRLPVRVFSRDTLEISDILLARRVIEKPERPFGRERFVILPNPVKTTPRSRKAYFYFEIYNLTRDAFGRTSYKITYQTKPVPTDDDETNPDWVTAVTQEVIGDHSWEPVYLALDLQEAKPGLRDFRVLIEDSLSSETASASTQYRIRW